MPYFVLITLRKILIMLLKVDARETEIIVCLKESILKDPHFANIELRVEALPIGDFILCDAENELVIIERKTLRDLAASIKDGRYEEQSFRLNGHVIPNHNIFYLIEGKMAKFKMFAKDKQEASMLYSAMFSIAYTKGFSLLRTETTEETATILCQMAYKLAKCISQKKLPYCNDTQANYCDVVKKVRKANINNDNIGAIMLSQIPGISSVSATAVMQKFKTISTLVQSLKEDSMCLEGIQYTASNGTNKNINKTVKQSIIQYFT